MPYIIADATHIDKSIQTISITAKIDFKEDAFKNNVYVQNKMREIQGKITGLLMDYFNYSVSEIISEKEYKEQINNNE